MLNQSLFIGVASYYSPLSNALVIQYAARVASDGGYTEGLYCLGNKLNSLG
jgi:hypothetical protein